jgi:hypothetical protein
MLRLLHCVTLFALATYASSSLAQTSTQLTASDLRATYAAIKSAIRKLQADFAQPYRDRGAYVIDPCGTVANHLLWTKRRYEDEKTFRRLGDIAVNVFEWTHTLSTLKYPRRLWEPLVSQYESEQLSLLIEPEAGEQEDPRNYIQSSYAFVDDLVRRLAEHRKSNPSLVRVVARGGCGAGEVVVTIATDPRGGQVLFIPTFFYEYCRARNLNPEDTTRCDRWREADDGQLHEVIGNYRYIAKWRDGTIRKGKLTFGRREDGKTITVRQ